MCGRNTGYGRTRRIHIVLKCNGRLRDQWIRDGDGFVVVYAVNSQHSVQVLQEIKKQIGRIRGNVPIVYVANKCDLRNSVAKDQLKLKNEIWIETSAKTGKNVESVFVTMVQQIRSTTKPKSKKCIIL
jgi:small GTP-binding protein